MVTAELISPTRVACLPSVSSKKRALEALSGLIASDSPTLTAVEIFDCLIGRERLGSTGLGHGVAIPHGRMSAIEQPIGAFIRLEEAVDYDAIDQRPVDLLFALLVPEDADATHLQLLAGLAKRFSDEDLCLALRGSCDPDTLSRLLVEGGSGG